MQANKNETDHGARAGSWAGAGLGSGVPTDSATFAGWTSVAGIRMTTRTQPPSRSGSMTVSTVASSSMSSASRFRSERIPVEGDRVLSGGTQRPELATTTSSQPSATLAVTFTFSGMLLVLPP